MWWNVFVTNLLHIPSCIVICTGVQSQICYHIMDRLGFIQVEAPVQCDGGGPPKAGIRGCYPGKFFEILHTLTKMPKSRPDHGIQ